MVKISSHKEDDSISPSAQEAFKDKRAFDAWADAVRHQMLAALQKRQSLVPAGRNKAAIAEDTRYRASGIRFQE